MLGTRRGWFRLGFLFSPKTPYKNAVLASCCITALGERQQPVRVADSYGKKKRKKQNTPRWLSLEKSGSREARTRGGGGVRACAPRARHSITSANELLEKP